MKSVLGLLLAVNLFLFSAAQYSTDRAALIDFYNSLSNPGLLGWTISNNLCFQSFVTCDGEDRVTKFSVSLGLDGTIPPSFGNMTRLYSLTLNNNLLHGSVPTELGLLTGLRILNLGSNGLTGNVPTHIGNMVFLETLDLSSNNFDGTIPTQLSNNGYLSLLALNDNSLTGNIPVQLATLGNMIELNLAHNLLDGTLPQEFGNFIKLNKLNLEYNKLSGQIPVSLSKLSGTLPIGEINLSHNRFTFTIPPTVRSMSAQYMYFAYNYIDCPAMEYYGFTNDFSDSDALCAICNGACADGEVCRVDGENYDQFACFPTPPPCTYSVDPLVGFPPLAVFVNGRYFDNASPDVICMFGNVPSTALIYTSEIAQCDVGNNPSGKTVDVVVLQSGLGDNCGAKFTYSSGSGTQDPHFHGFHGEKMEVVRDSLAANQLFHLFCSPSVTITTYFFEYPDERLFMTKFWVRLGETHFMLHLSSTPKVLTEHTGPFLIEKLGRKRIYIPGGHLEWDDSVLRVFYGYLQINFTNKVYLTESPYMNVELYLRQSPNEKDVTGIIGRTLNKQIKKEQFEKFMQFKAPLSDVIDFTCSVPLDTI